MYLLSILLFLAGSAGLFALYRMVGVTVSFAERRSNFVAAVSHELKTPLTAIRMAGLAAEAGLPDGVLQVLPGPGGSMGKHLALHMDIDGLTFTGSTPVGKLLMQYSGQSNLKRTFLELGGKSPNIVFADANLDKSAGMAAVEADLIAELNQTLFADFQQDGKLAEVTDIVWKKRLFQ